MISFFIRIIKLGLIIFNICYFLGTVWFIIAEIQLQNEREYHNGLDHDEFLAHNTEIFIDFYQLEDNTPKENTIIGLYYAFTTLSTVGFGDYAPRSNVERAIGSFILISGVAMFSFLMGNFIEILGTWEDLKADFDDGETLAKFFGTVRHFN